MPEYKRKRSGATRDAPPRTAMSMATRETSIVGPPCEWPHGDPLTWPDRLEEVPRCGQPGVVIGRKARWDPDVTIVACEQHDRLANEQNELRPLNFWSSIRWRPEMVRGRDGRP